MSRRSKRHSRKQRYLPGFIVLLVVGVLAIGGVVLLVARENRPPDGFVPKVTGAPALEVEQPFFELGDMHFNVPANVTYVLRNVGDQPLRILAVPQVQVLEGC